MTKVHSGLLLIGVGVAANLVGRLLMNVAGKPQSLALAGMFFVLTLVSVAVALFGLIRLVGGLAKRS